MAVDMPLGRPRLTSQARRITTYVHSYFRSQDERECEADVEIKTAAATGVSVRSVQRIKQQSKRGHIQSPPSRTRVFPVMVAVDGFDRDCIRREILAFYERGEIPTIDALLRKVKEPPVSLPGSKSSLNRLVKQLGFRYRKVESGRFTLMERDDVILARNKYLKILNENR